MALITGDLFNRPWKTLVNIGVNAGVAYAAAKLGGAAGSDIGGDEGVRSMIEELYANIYGWTAARILDVFWQVREGV